MYVKKTVIFIQYNCFCFYNIRNDNLFQYILHFINTYTIFKIENIIIIKYVYIYYIYCNDDFVRNFILTPTDAKWAAVNIYFCITFIQFTHLRKRTSAENDSFHHYATMTTSRFPHLPSPHPFTVCTGTPYLYFPTRK